MQLINLFPVLKVLFNQLYLIILRYYLIFKKSTLMSRLFDCEFVSFDVK